MVYLVVLLTFANLLFAGLRLTLSLMALKLGANALEVGVVTGLIMAIPALCSHWIGRWCDTHGNRRPAIIGAALLGLGALVSARSSDIESLWLASMLIGTGYILVSIAVNLKIAGQTTSSNRHRVYGLVGMAFSIGAMLGPFLFGHLVELLGHRRGFLVGAGAALLCATGMRSLERRPRDQILSPSSSPHGFALLRHYSLKPVYVASATTSLAWDLMGFLMPLIGTAFGLSASQIGTVLACFAAGGLLSRALLPFLTKRMSEWSLLRVSLSACALGYALLATVDSMLAYSIIGAFTGMVAGTGLPLVLTLIHASAPRGRTGEAMGLRASITCVGQTFMPIAFGALGATIGFGPVIAVATICMGYGSWASRTPQQRPESA